jgi:hypothetical protein
VNIFAPFLSACARHGGGAGLRAAASAISMQLQPAPDNAVARRLAAVFGLTLPLVSWQQQGLMQLHARYCSRFQCANCLIGRSVFQ